MISDTQFRNLSSKLASFGCGEREARIYLHCLSSGACSVQEIARGLSQNRLTVHSAVERLIEKGFLFETRKGKRRLIVAEPPSAFERLIQKKSNEVDLMSSQLDGIIDALSNVRGADESIPSVKFFEKIDGFKRMLEETLGAKNDVLVFTYVDLFSELVDPDYLENYFLRRADKGIHTRLIFPPCDFANRVNDRAERYDIEVRLLSPELTWRSGIFSWNNCLALKSFTQGKITCTIIENEDIAHFYRNIVFELIWQQAKQI